VGDLAKLRNEYVDRSSGDRMIKLSEPSCFGPKCHQLAAINGKSEPLDPTGKTGALLACLVDLHKGSMFSVRRMVSDPHPCRKLLEVAASGLSYMRHG
jgi:hypothetical protein